MKTSRYVNMLIELFSIRELGELWYFDTNAVLDGVWPSFSRFKSSSVLYGTD